MVKILKKDVKIEVPKLGDKIRILSELWEACLRNMSSFNPDIRFFIQVADHVTDYHQAYVVPDLRVVNHVLQDSRVAHLRLFLNTLTKLDRSSLLLMIYKLTPLRVSNVSTVWQDSTHEASKKIEDLKKLQV